MPALVHRRVEAGRQPVLPDARRQAHIARRRPTRKGVCREILTTMLKIEAEITQDAQREGVLIRRRKALGQD